MKVIVCQKPDEMGKFQGVINAFPHIWQGKILDVGCRSRLFRRALSESGYEYEVDYTGFDIYPPADVIGDLENGLPFKDQSFDIVIALDVLEHINNIHGAFDEICRIAKRFVVLTLPNAYELRGRIKFLVGLPLSGKYGLPPSPPQDRHRWLFSFAEAQKFVQNKAMNCGFTVVQEACLVGPRRRIVSFLTGKLPNFLSPWYLCLLARK